MAGSADDGPWGHPRPRRSQGQPSRDRAGVQGRLSDAEPAHRPIHGVAAWQAGSTQPASKAERDRPQVMSSLAQRGVAEGLGTAFLLAGVVGSGIMAAKLAGGNSALALLCNTLPTGAILTVLILTFGPVSGAHFNPAVSIALALRRELSPGVAAIYIGAQLAGAIIGVWAAHLMFELPLWQVSVTVRTGVGQWFAEGVATFGLLLTVLATRSAYAIGLHITAAYWFTASTSF